MVHVPTTCVYSADMNTKNENIRVSTNPTGFLKLENILFAL